MTSSDEDEQQCSSATGDLDESNDPIAAQSQSASLATVSAIDDDKTDASNQREPDPTPPGKCDRPGQNQPYCGENDF